MYNLCHKVLKPLDMIPAIIESLARQICRVYYILTIILIYITYISAYFVFIYIFLFLRYT